MVHQPNPIKSQPEPLVTRMDMELAMRWNALITALCALGCGLQSLHAAEVYRWVDEKGISHYSQLPPPDNRQQFGKVNTAFTPAQQALIAEAERERLQKQVLQQTSIPPSAAGAEQTCQQLQQDKESYLQRRIEEQYLSDRNDCEMSHIGTAALKQREACYQSARHTMDRSISQLPSVKLCSNQ